jgi:hypothetical protein
MARRVTLRVDPEAAAPAWWAALREAVAAGDAPPELAPLADLPGPDEVTLRADRLGAVLAWCRRLPGWADGPAHAPHPLLVVFD